MPPLNFLGWFKSLFWHKGADTHSAVDIWGEKRKENELSLWYMQTYASTVVLGGVFVGYESIGCMLCLDQSQAMKLCGFVMSCNHVTWINKIHFWRLHWTQTTQNVCTHGKTKAKTHCLYPHTVNRAYMCTKKCIQCHMHIKQLNIPY